MYSQAIIDEAGLLELTGLTQAAAQIRWLQRHGIPFTIRQDGRPRTTWGVLDAALLGHKGQRPNLSKVR